jgi:hypothetical protein
MLAERYHSLNAIVAQSKNCPFGVNSMIEIKSIRAISDSNGIQRAMFRLRSVPVFSDVVVFLSSILVLNQNDNF